MRTELPVPCAEPQRSPEQSEGDFWAKDFVPFLISHLKSQLDQTVSDWTIQVFAEHF